jgi:hypothetical protein
VRARVETTPDAPGTYVGTIHIFDAFTDGRALDLAAELRVQGDYVHAAVSPRPAGDPIWDELAAASECLPCPQAAGGSGEEDELGVAPLFEVRSGFWVDVHQSLHHAAIGRRQPPASAPKAPDDPA